ncbi:MAG TPA: ABC transporter permease [Bacteroidales bacterium]|nr:ABC transporter permease [Bacteroidales bacterium]HNQ82938.1 ABC transporter permease [Bacteroidales bacterium]HOX79224.1 ABC transporter permease [Bacteroidales bacterium]HPI87161.1 ABC transporter permease [Bacteroidales bacterium]HPM91360.1 ABC transporter permease [Bacteroidales bacterium]
MKLIYLIKRFFIEGADFLKQIYLNKFIIWELTKRDFKTSYVSNILGLSWAILEPLAMMFVLWFVFTFIRTGQKTSVPFALFLLAGLIAYDLFNKALNSATRGISNYGFLINKVHFRSAIIPLVKISSELIMHGIILVIVSTILILSGIPVTIYWLQVFYYLFATVFLLVGLTWLTSSVSLFFPDIKYIITIVMRVLFFFTPIFWEMKNIPENMVLIFRLNPLYYIVKGYRDSFLYGIPFWSNWTDTAYFWGLAGAFFIIGVLVFKRLRPYFAEMV